MSMPRPINAPRLCGCVVLLAVLALPARADTLAERFPTPTGFTRVRVEDGSFAASLRALPLAPPGTAVVAFDGRVIDAEPLAVAALDVGAKDLQQCADSIIRLDAEHRLASGAHETIAYAFTSGDVYAFDRYSAGVRPVVDARGRVRFEKKAAAVAPDQAALRGYLDIVFMYAGTASLAATTKPVAVNALAAGDFFVLGGFPGHAILILDVAKNESGNARYLLGEGYMPAQSFHVVETAQGGAWHALADDGTLTVPSWSKPFGPGSTRRMAPVSVQRPTTK